MLRRLRKLGIPKTDPDELTPEEQSRCGRPPAAWPGSVRARTGACV